MRTNVLRSFQGALLVFGVLSLTGAKDNGCLGGEVIEGGGSIEPSPLPPEPNPCPEGTHPEKTADCTGDEFRCVPDAQVCPMGYEPVTTCYAADSDGGGEIGAVEPADDGDSFCGPDEFCGKPSPVSSCFTECVPTGSCPPGQHEETYCMGVACDAADPDGCPEADDMCKTTCVDDDPNWCGPGWHAELICDGGQPPPPEPQDPNGTVDPTGGGSDPYDPPAPSGCYETCVPDQTTCPPGYHEEQICADPAPCPEGYACPTISECTSTCVADSGPCPPGQEPAKFCKGTPEGEFCEVVCAEPPPPPSDGGGSTSSAGAN